jgi:hypothetical protein
MNYSPAMKRREHGRTGKTRMLLQDAIIKQGRREPAAETFTDVEPSLQKWVERESRKQPTLHYDEMSHIGHEAFMCAYASYDHHHATKATFKTYMGNTFKMKVRNAVRRRSIERARCEPIDVDIEQEMVESPQRRWVDVWETLPPDAQIVADLAINPPVPVIMSQVERGGAWHNLRSASRECLIDMGWKNHRISQAFADLLECIH